MVQGILSHTNMLVKIKIVHNIFRHNAILHDERSEMQNLSWVGHDRQHWPPCEGFYTISI